MKENYSLPDIHSRKVTSIFFADRINGALQTLFFKSAGGGAGADPAMKVVRQ